MKKIAKYENMDGLVAPLIKKIETEADTWLIYEYLFYPCEDITTGGNVRHPVEGKAYYKSLYDSMFQIAPKEIKGE